MWASYLDVVGDDEHDVFAFLVYDLRPDLRVLVVVTCVGVNIC